MGGRRLILTSYSDDEDTDEHQQLQDIANEDNSQNNHQPVTNSNLDDIPITIPSSPENDYIDVPEDFSPRSNSTEPSSVPPTNYDGCPVGELLSSKGLNLRREWINTCLTGINPSRNVRDLARLCFEKFLVSNMNISGAGILPPSVHSMHLVDLPGPFVLQVDEIVNISDSLKHRYHESSTYSRCLKLSMTDGVQRVFGIEYRPIKELKVFSPAGLKVIVCNVHIRRGLLLLVPEAMVILGGIVEELEAARQRLVEEVNKPPRGRSRTREPTSLPTRATNAAWNIQNSAGISQERTPPGQAESNDITTATNPTSNSSNTVNINGSQICRERNSNLNPTSISSNTVNIIGSQISNSRERNSNLNPSVNVSRHVNGEDIEILESEEINPSVNGEDIEILESRAIDPLVNEEDIEDLDCNLMNPSISVSNLIRDEEIEVLERMEINPSVNTSDSNNLEEMEVLERRDINPSVDREGSLPKPNPFAENEIPQNMESLSLNHNQSFNDSPMNIEAEALEIIDEQSPNDVMVLDDAQEENPFVYLADLSTKWAEVSGSSPSIQGKVKCFLTGVKGFQFKNRQTYDLRVYVDDGSLISEILIDHKLVQERISHTPEEATSALSSSDTSRVRDMKEKLKNFQIFLINFEGFMLMEINHQSAVPVALTMEQGCPPSYLSLLLKRLLDASF